MLQPLDRIRRTFGLKVDSRFVSKLITTQYDDLRFSEDGNVVHPEMDAILELFGAMEHFADEANSSLAKTEMPGLSNEAQKEMDDVLERIEKMSKRSDGNSEEPGRIRKLFTKISDRSKGTTSERFASVFKASVETANALGDQVRAEKEYLQKFAELETAMSEGTILASNMRKRQNERFEKAVEMMTIANETLNAASPDSDDYAQIRHDTMTAQRAFDMENKRKLFATEIFTKMSTANDFAVTLAMSLAQKTLTKESLWIATTNSLSTNSAVFALAQANVSSMESLNEGAKMKSVLDKGNTNVIASIGQMSTELQKRATLIAHSGGPGVDQLKALASSLIQGQREIAPMREKLVYEQAQAAEKTHKATLTFQSDMRNEVVKGANLALAHQKEKRDQRAQVALSHAPVDVVDAEFTQEAVAVEVNAGQSPSRPRSGP